MSKAKVITKSPKKGVLSEDWFIQLQEEIKSIQVETIFISRIELLKGKWLIGQVIEDKVGDFKRAEIYGEKINEVLAYGLGVSSRELERCRQFYRKYTFKVWDKALANLPEGKNISWNKVLRLLTNPRQKEIEDKECKHEKVLIKCLDCGKVFKEEEFVGFRTGNLT